jgi:hypothetical protein
MSLRPYSIQLQKIDPLYLSHHQNENHSQILNKKSFQKNNKIQEFKNIQQATRFFIEIVGAIPRQSLIRKLLLMIFPKGKGIISIRKIQRNSNKELLLYVGENIDMIKDYFTQTIQYQWLEVCIQKISCAQRKHETDNRVLLFANEQWEKFQLKNRKLLPSCSDLLKEIDRKSNLRNE